MFDGIVGNYDRLNAILSLGLDRLWRRAAISALDPAPGRRYLDLGCGTGDLAIGLASCRRAPGARVLGVDPARRMIERAIEKTASLAGVAFAAGDALAIPAASGAFDGVITGFCLRNITDQAMALGEMARVTRGGGRLVILELTTPRGAVLCALHRLYGRIVVAGVGRLLSEGSAYRYLVDSIARFPAPEEIARGMERSGWTRIRSRALQGGLVTLFSGERGR